MNRGTPKLTEDHMEYLRRALRELVSEQACSWDEPLDEDALVDDEWIDWVETYEDAMDGLRRLGIDPYDDLLEWTEFLDPLGGFEPSADGKGDDEARFQEYLERTYGATR